MNDLSKLTMVKVKTIVCALVIILLVVSSILIATLFQYGQRLTSLEKDVAYNRNLIYQNSVDR